MSGALISEVHRAAGELHRLGVPRVATWTLAVIAEQCHTATRTGTAPLHYLARAIWSAEDEVAHCLQQLRDLALIVLVRRDGAGDVYRLAELDVWLAERGSRLPTRAEALGFPDGEAAEGGEG